MSDLPPTTELDRLNEANHASFFLRLDRRALGGFDGADRLRFYVTGARHPIFNGVIARAADVDPRTIGSVKAWFRRGGLPFTWWVTPSQHALGLGTRLEDAGMVRDEEIPGMALPRSALGNPPSGPADLRVEPVTDETSFETFGQTLNAGDFQTSEEIARMFPDLLRAEPGDHRFRFFVGYQGDRPVATALRFCSDGCVGIYGIATIPEARHRGIGARMTYAALRDGFDSGGGSTAVLQATPLGYPVYRRMGFIDIGKFRTYVPNAEA
jgi:ribosomal protein S18 acetylase RimI-like enzyme